MVGPESRYAEAEMLVSPSHTYDADGRPVDDSEHDLASVEWRQTLYMLTALPLPAPPDYQYQAKVTDDFPLLAHTTLGKDATKWWVVADANPHIRYPLDLKMGDIVYLPA